MNTETHPTYAAHIERFVAAPTERVWRAIATEELAEWYWPTRFETTATIDARVGGRFRVASAVTGMAVEGEFVAVEPTERLVYTWRWDGEDLETLVTMTLVTVDRGTTLVIDHERFTAADDCANHEQGWNDCIARLAALFESTER